MERYAEGEAIRLGFRVALLRGIGAGNETRTRDFHLGKVVLYQLSYSRLDDQSNCPGTRNNIEVRVGVKR